jgi:hypothetical protein
VLRLSTSPLPSVSGRLPQPKPSGKSRRWLALVIPFVLLAMLGAIACSGTSSTTVTPTTGILVRAETLTTGRGCGRSASNLFKYAVVVFGYESGDELAATSYTHPIAAKVFDCFTDGTFIQLAAADGGNSRYRLEVYAYNEPAYTAARDAIEGAAVAALDSGTSTTALKSTWPTWTTECTATQQRDVQALALCAPLAPGLTGLGGNLGATRITLGTTRFQLPDGRTAFCRTAPTEDGGVDAGTDADASIEDAGQDAEAGLEDAGLDAGPPVPFTTARIRYRTATFVGPVVDLPCPAVYTADVPAEPSRYDIDVGLLDGTQPLGQATCTATTQTGATSSAVCP